MVPPPKRHHGNDGDLASLSRPISPPPTKRAKGERDARQTGNSEAISHPQQPAGLESAVASRTISSPFRLSWIRDVEPADNVGALTIHDILGDPLIAECWNFNYLHDVDLIMDALDADVRRMVRMNIVHGFWKSSEPRRQHLEVNSQTNMCAAARRN